MSEMAKIDFVQTWVDCNDPDWMARKEAVWQQLFPEKKPLTKAKANDESRYREMGMFEFWFRGVEKFAPWVNKIYLITPRGQKPEWLNTAHPKLVLVHQEDYLPSDYPPIFNSIPVEMHLHRIPELSEQFVLFNDDMFLLRPIALEFFFKDGLPCLPADLTLCDYFGYNHWSMTCFNNYCVVNDHFNIYDALWKNRDKWFNPRVLGVKTALKNFLCYKVNRTLSVKGYEHLPVAHLKSTFDAAWSACPSILDATSRQVFRANDQVNHLLFCAWNQAAGKFHPERPYSHGYHFNISTDQLDEICTLISNQSVPEVCLNDSDNNDNPEKCFFAIREAFNTIFPAKSSFEL